MIVDTCGPKLLESLCNCVYIAQTIIFCCFVRLHHCRNPTNDRRTDNYKQLVAVAEERRRWSGLDRLWWNCSTRENPPLSITIHSWYATELSICYLYSQVFICMHYCLCTRGGMICGLHNTIYCLLSITMQQYIAWYSTVCVLVGCESMDIPLFCSLNCLNTKIFIWNRASANCVQHTIVLCTHIIDSI